MTGIYNKGFTMLSFKDAQKDMRDGYFFGIPGILCSGFVWLAAGLCAWLTTPFSGILTLFFGGMVIFPCSILLCKCLGFRGSHDKTNPLARLAIEGTVWMLLCIPLAMLLATSNPAYFFYGMLLVIAGRYLTFSSLYGLTIYYLFSAVLVLAALALFVAQLPAFTAALAGGLIEVVFALAILFTQKVFNNQEAPTS